MSLAAFAVKRYQFTVVLFLMLAALGVASWQRIPRAEDPVFPILIFNVFVKQHERLRRKQHER